MGQRRRALRDVLTVEQYREMLRTAARIKDKEESISLFFWVVVMGRLGLRVGEAIHMTESWYKPDRSVISVPPYEPCECGLCRHYAEKYADRHGLDFEEVLKDYWKVKDESDRDVQVPTERDREIIRLYFEKVPYTSVSYGTVNRRLKKLSEFVDGVGPENIYPHMMRATGATHLAWSGMAPPALDIQFGWQDEKTKEKYTEKTGRRVKLEYDRIWGRVKQEDLFVREDPPTYSELRPDDESELLEVDSWSVDGSVATHPRTRDEEPLVHDLDEFVDDKKGAFDPVSPAVQARLRYEHECLKASPQADAYPEPQRIALAGVGLLAASIYMGLVYAHFGIYEDLVTGDPTTVIGMGLGGIIGIPFMIWNVHETFHDDPYSVEPQTAFDRVIVTTHSLFDRIASPICDRLPAWWTG